MTISKHCWVRGGRLPLTQFVPLNRGGALSREGRGRINNGRNSRRRFQDYSALIPVRRIMPAQPSIEVLKKAGASPNATVCGS